MQNFNVNTILTSGIYHIDSLMSFNIGTLRGCFWTPFDP